MSGSSQNFFLTTAIDYANGSPHLGHAYEKVLADAVARHRRLSGKNVRFLTGLDEHGQKVQQTAAKLGKTPLQCCDEVAALFQQLCRDLDISNDDYIRTTEPRHKAVVSACLQKLFDQGDIYLAEYQGFYSVRQEQFVQEKDKLPDGSWPELYGEVILLKENNYFFKLARHQDWLREHIRSNPGFILPEFRANQVLEFLKEPINDLCISRPVERLSWGIPLPFNPGYVTYVWFDALLNYFSGDGRTTPEGKGLWPADLHVIGKDILVPPHAVYWPIMLKALGLEPPRCILAHGWWLSAGRKVSKTKTEADAVAVPEKSALELAAELGPDSFRHFVLREMSVGQDADYSEAAYRARYEADLANNLGNLAARVQNLTERNCGGKVPLSPIPQEEPEKVLQAAWEEARPAVLAACETYRFSVASEKIFGFFKATNVYLETRAPWKLAKSADPAAPAQILLSLATVAEALRLGSTLLAPLLPSTSEKLLLGLGLPPAAAWDVPTLTWNPSLLAGSVLGPKVILFPKPAPASKG